MSTDAAPEVVLAQQRVHDVHVPLHKALLHVRGHAPRRGERLLAHLELQQREGERERQTDRQTHRHTDTQIDTQTDRQTHTHRHGRETPLQASSEAGGEARPRAQCVPQGASGLLAWADLESRELERAMPAVMPLWRVRSSAAGRAGGRAADLFNVR